MVADGGNNRLCLFSNTGAFLRSLPTGRWPFDMVECDGGTSFIVANCLGSTLYKVSAATGAFASFGSFGSETGQFNWPVALATVQRGGTEGGVELVVLDKNNSRVQVFRV